MKNGELGAFPAMERSNADNSLYLYNEGLTKREYFAAKAMQAVIARDHGHTMTQNVITAVAYADALLDRLAESEATKNNDLLWNAFVAGYNNRTDDGILANNPSMQDAFKTFLNRNGLEETQP